MNSVFITGVAGGIGQATARHLMKVGWQVFGADVGACEIKNELSGFWVGDVAEEAFWTESIVPGIKCVGLRGLVNNAAIQPCRSIQDTTLEEWDRTIAVNLGAAFLATKYVAPLMNTSGASIVNVSSVHAMATSPGMAAYVASKGGLLAFTRAAALELAELGIRVNAVLPGATDTNMLQEGTQRTEQMPNDVMQHIIARTPLMRIAKPAEVSAMIDFLLDDEKSAFITGQSYVVDGGVLARLSSE